MASGDWNSTSTWSTTSGGAPGASVPISTTAVTIERGYNVTVNIDNAAASTLQIGGTSVGNGTLTFNAGSRLDISNGVTLGNGARTGSLDFTAGGVLRIGVSGTGTLVVTTIGTFTPGLGTIDYGDNAAQIVATTAALGSPYNNLTLSNTSVKTTTGVTVNGVFSLEGTATSSVAPTYGASATLQYNTTSNRTVGSEWITPFVATGGVRISNTGTMTLNGAKVMDTNVPLEISNGGTLATNNFQLTLGGHFLNDLSSLAGGSSNIFITGPAAVQNINHITTTGTISFTKTAGTAFIGGNLSGSGFTVNGPGAILDLGGGHTHTFTGTWTRTDGTVNLSSSTIRFGAGFSGTGGTFNTGVGTVEWFAAGAQTIAVLNYYNLILSGSGVKTMTSVSSVTNDFTIAGSASATPATTFTVGGITQLSGTSTLTLGAANILADAGAFILDGGTFRTGATTGNSETVGTLTLTNNSTIALGTGSHDLHFAASNSFPWIAGKTLTITGWTGGYNGTSGTAGKIFVGSLATHLTAAQVSQIRFYNGSTYFGATILGTGEIVPTSTINFYSKSTGALNLVATWTSDITLVQNIPPVNFTTANQIFNIRNNAAPTIAASWTVSGSGSKIIVGDGVNACNFTVGGALSLTAPTDVSKNGTLTLSTTANPQSGIVFGTLATGSTVNYASPDNQTVNVAPYYHLTLSGTTTVKTITGLTTVNGNFTFGGSASATATTGITIGGNVVLGSGTTFVAGAFTHNVGGNWTNNGGTFTNTGCTINFNNTLADQTINGTATTQTFNNLTVNKSTRKLSINGSTTTVIVSGILTMTSGNINCGANTLQLGTSTVIIGTLNYTAGNIVGKFMRWFNTTGAKTFPLGTSSGSGNAIANRNALVTFTNLTNGSLTGSFVPVNPGATGLPLMENSITLIHQFTEGYWSLVAANSLASNNYALELTGDGFTSYGQEGEVRIIKRPNGGGSWTLNGTHVTMVGATAKRTGLSGFSEFAHASRCPGTNAGPDQTAFNTSSFTMAATLSEGTGEWTIDNGAATVTFPNSPITSVTGIALGASVTLRWTQTSGPCADFDLVTLTNSALRNTDLPTPDANFVTAPAGTFVIPMDSLNYMSYGVFNAFNVKTYGLVVKLLNNKKALRWIIKAGKVHDGIDFTASAKRILPTAEANPQSRSFRAGPILIYPQDTVGVRAVINAYNAGQTNKINIYKLTNDTQVDERYRLTQRPKVAVLNNGGNGSIHASYMTNASIQLDSNYTIVETAENLFQECYTFASEPHSSAVNAVLDSIRSYVVQGGNFLGECLAVNTYENSAAGRYQTDNGLTIRNITPASGYAYPNADLSFGQYLNEFDPVSLNGAERNWSLTGSSFINNGHKIQSGAGAGDTLIGQSVSKLLPGAGHLVFYIGAHTYAGQGSVSAINGERAYFSAMLTPSAQNSCGFESFDADIAVTKSAEPTFFCFGSGNITFKIVVENLGPSSTPAGGLTLQEVLPPGVTYVSHMVSQGSYNSITGLWSIGSLALNEKDSLILIVMPNIPGTKTNKAYINRYQFDFNQTNDTSTVAVYVNEVTPGTVSGSQSLCAPADPAPFTVSVPATGTGTLTYQWQSNTIGCDNGDPWMDIQSATSDTFDIPAGLMTTTYYRRIVTSDYFSAQCSAASNCLTVMVGSNASCAITGNNNVCPGTTNTYSTTGGMTSYSWSIMGNGSISGSTTGPSVMVIAGSTCGSYTLTVVATLNGCSVMCQETYNITDGVAPMITTCAVTRNIEGCNTGAITGPAFSITSAVSSEAEFENMINQGIVSDNCGITSVTYLDVAVGTCPTVVTRTWTITDACGNSSMCNQTINVDDNTIPMITCPMDMTISCTASTLPVNTGNPMISDNCVGSPVINYNDVTTAGSCPQEFTITRTWMVTDVCLNTNTCVQVITIDDSVVPLITCPMDMTISCTSSTAPATTGFATATDLCDGNPMITHSDVTTSGGCPQEYTIARTWVATDACGNSSSCTQTIVVDDSTPPVCIPQDITLSVDPNTRYVLITPDDVDGGSNDNCGPVMVSISQDSFICENAGINNVILTVTDLCGNTSTCTAIVTINECFDTCVTVNAWVYIEGASTHPNGLPTYGLPMRTTLNNIRVLPGQTLIDPFFGIKYSPPGQPYSIAPWNYPGTEGDAYDSGGDPMMGGAGYPATVVDWVLVSLRDNAAGTGGPVCQAAALLHNNGYIEFVQDFDCCDLDLTGSYYVVIEHRNHLIVMSDIPVPIVPGVDSSTITYNFRDKQSFVDDPFMFGIFARQRELLPNFPGSFGMFAGNGNQVLSGQSDTDINFDDRTYWEVQNGSIGLYRAGDYNLNGDTNFNDRVTWERNNGKFTSVPRN